VKKDKLYLLLYQDDDNYLICVLLNVSNCNFFLFKILKEKLKLWDKR